VYGYAIKPAGYTGGKVPVVLTIHGGPHLTQSDRFYGYQNEVFAGHGYGVIAIDFHGSAGYGQAFNDAVLGDWAGAPYDDLMTGLDAALDKYPWLDKTRMVAFGFSYGGYMVNWINGHTDRFRALICDAGVFDMRMFYLASDASFSEERELGGVPWDKPQSYAKASPSEFVKNWKTPTLVIHGGKDYQVSEWQGLGAFTALQRRGLAWIDTWTRPR
jgi:dipeptidyl aminopeptidase/acylaminoacyl peptidase